MNFLKSKKKINEDESLDVTNQEELLENLFIQYLTTRCRFIEGGYYFLLYLIAYDTIKEYKTFIIDIGWKKSDKQNTKVNTHMKILYNILNVIHSHLDTFASYTDTDEDYNMFSNQFHKVSEYIPNILKTKGGGRMIDELSNETINNKIDIIDKIVSDETLFDLNIALEHSEEQETEQEEKQENVPLNDTELYNNLKSIKSQLQIDLKQFPIHTIAFKKTIYKHICKWKKKNEFIIEIEELKIIIAQDEKKFKLIEVEEENEQNRSYKSEVVNTTAGNLIRSLNSQSKSIMGSVTITVAGSIVDKANALISDTKRKHANIKKITTLQINKEKLLQKIKDNKQKIETRTEKIKQDSYIKHFLNWLKNYNEGTYPDIYNHHTIELNLINLLYIPKYHAKNPYQFIDTKDKDDFSIIQNNTTPNNQNNEEDEINSTKLNEFYSQLINNPEEYKDQEEFINKLRHNLTTFHLRLTSFYNVANELQIYSILELQKYIQVLLTKDNIEFTKDIYVNKFLTIIGLSKKHSTRKDFVKKTTQKLGSIPTISMTLLPSPTSLLPSPTSLLPSPTSLLPSPTSLLPSPTSLLPSHNSHIPSRSITPKNIKIIDTLFNNQIKYYKIQPYILNEDKYIAISYKMECPSLDISQNIQNVYFLHASKDQHAHNATIQYNNMKELCNFNVFRNIIRIFRSIQIMFFGFGLLVPKTAKTSDHIFNLFEYTGIQTSINQLLEQKDNIVINQLIKNQRQILYEKTHEQEDARKVYTKRIQYLTNANTQKKNEGGSLAEFLTYFITQFSTDMLLENIPELLTYIFDNNNPSSVNIDLSFGGKLIRRGYDKIKKEFKSSSFRYSDINHTKLKPSKIVVGLLTNHQQKYTVYINYDVYPNEYLIALKDIYELLNDKLQNKNITYSPKDKKIKDNETIILQNNDTYTFHPYIIDLNKPTQEYDAYAILNGNIPNINNDIFTQKTDRENKLRVIGLIPLFPNTKNENKSTQFNKTYIYSILSNAMGDCLYNGIIYILKLIFFNSYRIRDVLFQIIEKIGLIEYCKNFECTTINSINIQKIKSALNKVKNKFVDENNNKQPHPPHYITTLFSYHGYMNHIIQDNYAESIKNKDSIHLYKYLETICKTKICSKRPKNHQFISGEDIIVTKKNNNSTYYLCAKIKEKKTIKPQPHSPPQPPHSPPQPPHSPPPSQYPPQSPPPSTSDLPYIQAKKTQQLLSKSDTESFSIIQAVKAQHEFHKEQEPEMHQNDATIYAASKTKTELLINKLHQMPLEEKKKLLSTILTPDELNIFLLSTEELKSKILEGEYKNKFNIDKINTKLYQILIEDHRRKEGKPQKNTEQNIYIIEKIIYHENKEDNMKQKQNINSSKLVDQLISPENNTTVEDKAINEKILNRINDEVEYNDIMYVDEHKKYIEMLDLIIEQVMTEFYTKYSFIIQLIYYIFTILSSILEKQTFTYVKQNQNVPNAFSYINLNHITEIVNNIKFGAFTLFKELKDISEIANTSEFDKQFNCSITYIETKYKILPLLKNAIIPIIMKLFHLIIRIKQPLIGGRRTKKKRPFQKKYVSKKKTHHQRYNTKKYKKRFI